MEENYTSIKPTCWLCMTWHLLFSTNCQNWKLNLYNNRYLVVMFMKDDLISTDFNILKIKLVLSEVDFIQNWCISHTFSIPCKVLYFDPRKTSVVCASSLTWTIFITVHVSQIDLSPMNISHASFKLSLLSLSCRIKLETH